MDAVKFLKGYDRMCKSYGFDCDKCGIHKVRKGEGCIETVVEHPEETVAAVEKWVDDHPVRTRQSEFLKMFPNAKILNGIISICPKHIDEECGTDCVKDCNSCRKEYWFTEVE